LKKEDQQRIITAIGQAELATSGEIRVHIEAHCPDNEPVVRAFVVFDKLGMRQTQDKNGVLFYLAADDRKFAIVGDSGIDAVVPADFWESTKDILRQHFSAGDIVLGLCEGIERAGQQLKQYFPRAANDKNELPDEISFE
jgi:uncharacterized membrane protein